jgi:voltage-gated potassium channel
MVSRLQRALQWPLAFLALLVVPALLVEERATSRELRAAAVAVNWAVWIAFCFDFVLSWATERRWLRSRRAWFDLVLIVLTPPFLVPESVQGLRSLRALRLLRLVRAVGMLGIGLRTAQRSFGARKFHLVGLFALATIILGAAGVFLFESGANPSIDSFGDALWWATVTATTVGYGDVSPVTLEGRVIAVLLMVTGIGFIGVFTATVASFFIEQDTESEVSSVQARLDAIERKLDRVLREREEVARSAEAVGPAEFRTGPDRPS